MLFERLEKPSKLPQKEQPEGRVEELEKAHEMAKAEDVYRTLAINARKAGFENLAREWEKLGGEKAEEAGKEWERKSKEIEMKIKEIVEEMINRRNEFLKEEQLGTLNRDRESFTIKDSDADFIEKIKHVLGVKELLEIKGKMIRSYLTEIERVIFEEYFSFESTLPRVYIEIHNRQSWEKELEKRRKAKGFGGVVEGD